MPQAWALPLFELLPSPKRGSLRAALENTAQKCLEVNVPANKSPTGKDGSQGQMPQPLILRRALCAAQRFCPATLLMRPTLLFPPCLLRLPPPSLLLCRLASCRRCCECPGHTLALLEGVRWEQLALLALGSGPPAAGSAVHRQPSVLAP